MPRKAWYSNLLYWATRLMVAVSSALCIGGSVFFLLRVLDAQDAELSGAVCFVAWIAGWLGSRPRSFLGAVRALPLLAQVTVLAVSVGSAVFLGNDPWLVRPVRFFASLVTFSAFAVLTHRRHLLAHKDTR